MAGCVLSEGREGLLKVAAVPCRLKSILSQSKFETVPEQTTAVEVFLAVILMTLPRMRRQLLKLTLQTFLVHRNKTPIHFSITSF